MSIPNNRVSAYIIITDILLVCIFILCACIHFCSIKVSVSDTKISVTQGIFIKSAHNGDFLKSDSINTTQGPLQKLMGIHKTALVFASAEVILYLSAENLAKLLRKTAPDTKNKLIYKSSFISSLIMSAIFHNSVASVLTLTPLLRSIGSVIDSEFAVDFLEDADVMSLILPKISPALSAFTTLIFCLWVLGFCVTFCRYYPLKIFADNKIFTIKHGVLIKHTHKIKPTDIRSILIRRSFLLLILKKHCAELRFSLEKGENHMPVFCGKKATLEEHSPFLFTSDKTKTNSPPIRPNPHSLWGYLWLPILTLSLVSFSIITTDTLSVYTLLPLFPTLLIFWLCLWFFLRFGAFCHSAVFLRKNILTIRSFSLLSLTEAVIPQDKIRAVKISRTIFQKRRGTCTLRIYIKSRSKKSFFVKHIEYKKTAELVNKLCGNYKK